MNRFSMKNKHVFTSFFDHVLFRVYKKMDKKAGC